MIFTTMFCFTLNFLKLSRKFIPLFADLQLSDEVCREAFWRRFSPHPRHSHYSRHNHHVMLMAIMKIHHHHPPDHDDDDDNVCHHHYHLNHHHSRMSILIGDF